jgi:tetratricopeptide (TPR) repeat protein
MSARAGIAVIAVLLALGIGIRLQLARMDQRFFAILSYRVTRGDDDLTHRTGRSLQFSLPALKGLVFYLGGDYERAARAYRAHLRDFTEFGDAPDPAQAALIRGDLATARRVAGEVLRRNPADLDARLTLGQAALDDNALDEALAQFNRVLERDRDQFDALLLSSVAHARSRDYGRAVDDLKHALRHWRIETRRTSFLAALQTAGELSRLPTSERPACLLAYYHRYLRIFDISNDRRAIAYSEQAIRTGDRPDDAYVTIGVIRLRHGKRRAALEAFTKATSLNPKNPDAFRWAATAYAEIGDLASEYRMTRAAAEAAPEDFLYGDLLQDLLLKKLGDYRQALTLALARQRAQPDDAENLRRLGEIYMALGERSRAVESLERAVRIQPKQPELYEWLGRALSVAGAPKEAEAALKKAIELLPDRAAPHLYLGHLYTWEHRPAEAIAAYERALALGAGGGGVFSQLCWLYETTHQYERAVWCYQAVRARDPGNVFVQDRLPWAQRGLDLSRRRP